MRTSPQCVLCFPLFLFFFFKSASRFITDENLASKNVRFYFFTIIINGETNATFRWNFGECDDFGN